ncbi:MAG: glycosyltransferase family 2 protein [Rhodospirillales bacterium]|nr:MAG: glycosyltransferase family 2 protein [Rhodospirillales bacterium]
MYYASLLAKSMRKTTIGLTSFNAQDTIERAVQSALAQDWSDLEVIVVDDCSSDGSWDILRQLAAAEPRLRVFRHKTNKGYPGALNTILDHARGDFVAIFDDDDDNVPNRVRSQVERISAYEDRTGAALVLCYANRNVVKGGQSAPDHVALAIGRTAPEPSGPEVADFLFGVGAKPGKVWGMFGSCTLMARRTTFVAVGPFDETFRRCAEWDLAVRAAFMGAHFIAVDRPLVTMYKTPGTDKSGSIPLKYALLLREKHHDYLVRRGLYHASRLIARSNFHGNKGRIWKSRAYRALACMASPVFATQSLSRVYERAFRKRLRSCAGPH